jgi:hypothetical protein
MHLAVAAAGSAFSTGSYGIGTVRTFILFGVADGT